MWGEKEQYEMHINYMHMKRNLNSCEVELTEHILY